MIKNHRRLATLLVGGLAVLTLAACGSNSPTASGGQSAPSGNSSGQAGAGTGRGGFPGVSGMIVALSGKTAQVRTASGQSAVSYTSKTSVTEEKSAKASDVKTGLCATVRSAESASSGSSPSTTMTAASVSLTDKVDGSCQGGFGFGNRPSGMPSGGPAGQGQPPSGAPQGGTGAGAPSGMPSGARPSGAGRGGFGGAGGTITAVNGSTITVEQARGTETTSITVTLTSDTTYTKQVKADTDAIAKGQCVFATGKTDSTGALTATAMRLSAPVDGECGFGGQGRRNGSGG